MKLKNLEPNCNGNATYENISGAAQGTLIGNPIVPNSYIIKEET